jgi:hypothetical protein
MANEVKIQKTVFNSEDFKKVVDTEFKTFTQPEIIENVETVNELFRLYDKLFYSIPIEGPNSHQYLVERSMELYKFEQTQEEIQPLLDEIADLRTRLLAANQEIITIQTNK